MSQLTITEALAELKVLDARVEKKHKFIAEHLVRQERFKDPLAKDGGQEEVIRRERQAISDLQERKLVLRRAIQRANEATVVVVSGTARPIADWLVWRREIAPQRTSQVEGLWRAIQGARAEANRKALAVVTTADVAKSDNDLRVNLDEGALAAEIEELQATLGALDGQLSLRNATTMVEV